MSVRLKPGWNVVQCANPHEASLRSKWLILGEDASLTSRATCADDELVTSRIIMIPSIRGLSLSALAWYRRDDQKILAFNDLDVLWLNAVVHSMDCTSFALAVFAMARIDLEWRCIELVPKFTATASSREGRERSWWSRESHLGVSRQLRLGSRAE